MARVEAAKLALKVEASQLRYRAMIGTGGIGSGVFFQLNGNHTLGREESRGGRFLDRQDYCKLHIISHYVQTLLGPVFETIPLGKVGDDEVGAKLLSEMGEAGMNTRYVAKSPGDPTLYSFCFIYPDGSGGNLTTDDSASSKVDADLIEKAALEFTLHQDRGIALAAPEVPLEARAALLELGTKHGFFRAASFTTEELPIAINTGLLEKLDLLAINVSEAAAAAGLSVSEYDAAGDIVEQAVDRLSKINSRLLLSLTAGAQGSWSWDGASLAHVPKCDAPVASTAGAGDAYLSGLLVGLAAGLSFGDAHELAALVAGLSITSPHTINKQINRQSLYTFAKESKRSFPDSVNALLEA